MDFFDTGLICEDVNLVNDYNDFLAPLFDRLKKLTLALRERPIG